MWDSDTPSPQQFLASAANRRFLDSLTAAQLVGILKMVDTMLDSDEAEPICEVLSAHIEKDRVLSTAFVFEAILEPNERVRRYAICLLSRAATVDVGLADRAWQAAFESKSADMRNFAKSILEDDLNTYVAAGTAIPRHIKRHVKKQLGRDVDRELKTAVGS